VSSRITLPRSRRQHRPLLIDTATPGSPRPVGLDGPWTRTPDWSCPTASDDGHGTKAQVQRRRGPGTGTFPWPARSPDGPRPWEFLKTADWANTTIAAGDTAEEIDKLRLGGDGHIVVWGGASLWRSLMRRDLIDELQLTLFPYVAGARFT
jgi:hypothetical protein